jgi:hypothetical protein
LVFNGGRGFNVLNNGGSPVYFRHNTAYGNNTEDDIYACAEGLIDQSSNVESFLNLVETGATSGCGSFTYAAYQVNQTGANGATVRLYNNFGYSAVGNNISLTGTNTGFMAGPDNTFADPGFANPIEPGAPSCSAYANVPACMAQVIANFTPTNPAAAGYGYQIPSSTPVYDPLFPQWLCSSIVPALLSAGVPIENGCLQASASTGSISGGTLK